MPEARRPKKRLALFLDGTWNRVGSNTNVWRLRCLCAEKGADGVSQLRHYDEGVNGFAGGGWGKGLSDNVRQAYDWVVDHYEDGDEIFLFGFSRGAYTARSLAGLVATCGVLKAGGPLGVDQLYDRYRRADNDRTIYRLRLLSDGLSLEEKWLLRYSREAHIKMVGVWDTVGTLGIPVLSIPGISSSTLSFHHTGLRRPIQHGFHAVAIDEHRQKFMPTLWTVRTPRGQQPLPMRPVSSVEQRWFIGAHANVGGGCRSDLLAQIPLHWMMRKAAQCGLAFRRDLDFDGAEPLAPIADSFKEFLKGAYALFSTRAYRPIGAAPAEREDGTHATVNETIDASVFERWRSDPRYRPPNLAAWAESRAIDPAGLTRSVFAADPALEAPD
jgi:uncharacterized protein (DUF2235 family)